MFVADDKIQRAGVLLTGTSCRSWRRCRTWASFSRRALVFFVMHVKRANDEELPGGTDDVVQDFPCCARRSLEAYVDHVALN